MPEETPDLTDQERIERALRRQIISGTLKVGDKVPSTAELASTYQTSTSTVSKAVRTLREEGTLTGQKGKAVWVKSKPGSEGTPTHEERIRSLEMRVSELESRG